MRGERLDFNYRSCKVLEDMLEPTPLHMVINQTAKHTILLMAAEGCEKRRIVSSLQIKALGKDTPLALLPKELKVSFGSKTAWSDSSIRVLDLCEFM